jgi:hypothetical protein
LFAIGGSAMAGVWAYIRLGNFSNYYYIAAVLSGLGLVFGLVVALQLKFMKVGELQDGGSIL